MKKVAIIDTLGEHEGSFHFYTFGQCIGLINNNVDLEWFEKHPDWNWCWEFIHYNSNFKSEWIEKLPEIKKFNQLHN